MTVPDEAWAARLDALEARVRASAVAQQHVTGTNICYEDGTPFQGMVTDDGEVELNAEEAIAVFMLLDNSVVRQDFTYWSNEDGQPEGAYVHSRHAFIDPAWEENVTGMYFHKEDAATAGLYLSGVYLHQIFFRGDEDVPERLLSAGLALMAIHAWRLGFHELSLLAGGCAPGHDGADQWAAQGMIGYFVFPKFGFDAPVAAAELETAPHLQACRTVQDIVARDAQWWQETGGQGRTMVFDLTADSTSWRVLLDYLEPWLQAEEQVQ